MGLASALALIESVKDHRVLFVGDTIIDEYHYVRAYGKSPKEFLIPVEFDSKEVFHGGIEAAANHAKTFFAKVDVASFGPITRKVRMVDRYSVRKLFEIHYNGERVIDKPVSMDYDAIVIADFGHGAVSDELVARIYESKAFVAVDAQTNSTNIGFNLITKYPRADYIVIDEPEARLAAADREGPIEEVIEKIAQGRCNKLVVTLGQNGAIGYQSGRFYTHPAMSRNVLDTMGAGDAFFAVTAPMAKTGDMEDLLLIGNAAGALKTQIVGHRQAVTKEGLINYLRANA